MQRDFCESNNILALKAQFLVKFLIWVTFVLRELKVFKALAVKHFTSQFTHVKSYEIQVSFSTGNDVLGLCLTNRTEATRCCALRRKAKQQQELCV